MGENRLFWPQEMMDEWIVDEKASIKDDLLTIIDDNLTYKLSQAVHFIADVGDGDDVHSLIGKVKELDALAKMDSEHYMDSVLINDSAYQVVQGFTGIPVVNSVIQTVQPAPVNQKSQAPVVQQGEGEDSEDRELLANFLLDNL